MMFFRHIFLLIVICTFWVACIYGVKKEVPGHLVDHRYDSEFPQLPTAPALKEILSTVHFLNTVAFYRGYVFPSEVKLTVKDLSPQVIRQKATQEIFFNHTASGTATMVYAQGRYIALLTCAHIINFPDTIVAYRVDKYDRPTPFLESVAVKTRQHIYVADLPLADKLKVLIKDDVLDVALVGQELEREPLDPIPVFDYPVGSAKELDWGTFVYVIGFPKGQKMITRGLVSQPNRNAQASFLVDAPFNRGFSGGIVLALRDGVPNFELVGLVNSVSVNRQLYLAPGKDFVYTRFRQEHPYRGDIYVKQLRQINYGVTFAISIDVVQDFIQAHSDVLLRQGFDPSLFFTGPPREPRPQF